MRGEKYRTKPYYRESLTNKKFLFETFSARNRSDPGVLNRAEREYVFPQEEIPSGKSADMLGTGTTPRSADSLFPEKMENCSASPGEKSLRSTEDHGGNDAEAGRTAPRLSAEVESAGKGEFQEEESFPEGLKT